MKFALTVRRYFLASAIVYIMIFASLFTVNPVNATHTDCTNWAGLPDKDCDQLADAWETGNKTYTENGITVQLPSGVSMNHRDILVEIDFMDPHIPPPASIDIVVNAFRGFELLNPDNTYGVNLHYIIDDSIQHENCINIYEDADTIPTNDFKSIKENFMGTQNERSLNSNVYQAKMDVFHYALFVHTQCGNEPSSGIGETPGNDFVVSLGYPGWGNVINGHDTGSNDYKAATFMHELGHNLNLKHGGSADNPNCKPNYISVMNYAFQFPTYASSRSVDYSHSVIPALNEAALVENNGIGPSSPVNLETAVGHTVSGSHSPLPHYLSSNPGPYANNSPINYNWYTGSTGTGQTVGSSITNFHFIPCNDNTQSWLYGYDDVHYNSFLFWANSGPFQNATVPPELASGSGTPMPSEEFVTNLTNVSTIDVDSPLFSNELIMNLSSISPPRPFIVSGNYDVLKDPKLAPCDVTVDKCQDSPCDPNDPSCVVNKEHNFTNPQLGDIDVGVVSNVTEITAIEVLNATTSKVLDINTYIQSINQSSFVNGTDVSTLKKDLQNSLVNGSDSVYNLINSSNPDLALGKILKLRSLVDGTHASSQVLEYPENINLLNLVDDLRITLEKRR